MGTCNGVTNIIMNRVTRSVPVQCSRGDSPALHNITDRCLMPVSIYHHSVLNTPPFCKRLPSHTSQEQACSRITWLFVRSWPCRKWPNTQENGCWLPLSDHIQSETLFQTRQDQGKEWMVQPVFCLVYAGSCCVLPFRWMPFKSRCKKMSGRTRC